MIVIHKLDWNFGIKVKKKFFVKVCINQYMHTFKPIYLILVLELRQIFVYKMSRFKNQLKSDIPCHMCAVAMMDVFIHPITMCSKNSMIFILVHENAIYQDFY